MSVADVKCPYCEDENGYEPEQLDWSDGAEQEKTCRWCGEKFIVITSYCVNFEAETLEERGKI